MSFGGRIVFYFFVPRSIRIYGEKLGEYEFVELGR